MSGARDIRHAPRERIRSTPAMKAARVGRQLADRIEALRLRAENLHLGERRKEANRALRAAGDGRLEDAGRLADDLERAINAHVEAQEAEVALAAQAAQAEKRGVEQVRTGKGPPTRDGLLWLAAKARIDADQVSAGARYGKLYAQVHGGRLRSCLGDSAAGGAPDASAAKARAERAGTAGVSLMQANRVMLASLGERHGRQLVGLVEAVCGRGETLRELASGDDRRALTMEVELRCGLDMLAMHFGIYALPRAA